ncbi:uncharacterized protein Rv2567 [Rubritalea halochordaticola]|uniref:Uncharacterized protein Rv2567 n=1 Tax=Rubritalea halochordaticola TaxID=714537 RepID=A0ABP9UZ66_9BACT
MPDQKLQSQASTRATSQRLFDLYRPNSKVFDESQHSAADSKSLWQELATQLNQMGFDGLNTAWRRGEDMLHENGVAHDLMPENKASSRRWDLDPIPLLMSEKEWNFIHKAVIQRANLLEKILQDCYGSQNLISDGIIPPSLVLSHPGFNRSLHQINQQKRRLLTTYAVDIAREPDGSWRVISDRTEAPNGAGLALENRIVLSSVFPDTSKRLKIIRLANYFQEFNTHLKSLAPEGVDTPGIAMLSPGPEDRAYFEDAFLTRYLGITLTVGTELTVRNDRLYLKTVQGLKRIHVLLRRISGNDTDPLDMPSANSFGVPGLIHCIRAGTVQVINPPGTGILEAPAFLPYLPAIARHLLNEDLLIPSIETHWDELSEDSLECLDSKHSIIKSAFERDLFSAISTRQLNDQDFHSLRDKVIQNPQSYVVQREMPFSAAPVWNGIGFESCPFAIRLFLFADEDQYKVMPGGLVRSAAHADMLPGLSLHENSSSKDLWVCSSGKSESKVNPRPSSRVSIRRSTGSLSSRSADNMLWTGRYAERTEFVTRVLLEILQTTVAEQDGQEMQPIPPLLHLLAKMHYLSKEQSESYAPVLDQQKLLSELTSIYYQSSRHHGLRQSSIPDNITKLRQLAALSRHRLSKDTWRIIQSLDTLVSSSPPKTLAGLRVELQQALLLHSAFNGTCRENLTRNVSWQFLNIGRRLERSIWILALLDELLALYPIINTPVLDAVLCILDSSMTYRFRYQGTPQLLPALDLILFDPENPRGLAYQLHDLDQSFAELPPPAEGVILRPSHTIVRKALNFLQTELLNNKDETSELESTHLVTDYIRNLRKDLPKVYEMLSWEFFTHTTFTAS